MSLGFCEGDTVPTLDWLDLFIPYAGPIAIFFLKLL